MGRFAVVSIVYTASSAVLLVYAGSLAILQAERAHPGARITTFGDAVWWSMSTVTTVGYGDESPVTGEGRVVAVLMMVGGIGLVGAVTATLASWVVQRVAQEDTEHQAATAAHIETLRADAQKQFEELHGEIARLANAVTAQHQPHHGARSRAPAASIGSPTPSRPPTRREASGRLRTRCGPAGGLLKDSACERGLTPR